METMIIGDNAKISRMLVVGIEEPGLEKVRGGTASCDNDWNRRARDRHGIKSRGVRSRELV